MTGLNIAPGFTLPLEAVTETFAILAVKRAGKSNAAVVMAEEMYDADVPWVAIDPKGDWWGVRAAGDGLTSGLSVLVFGGLHGDIPLEPTAGRLVADLVAEKRITCVLDVSEMTRSDQRRFLAEFADRLYRRNTEPLHVFCEEADEYIPQMVRGESAKVVAAFETLVKRGGFRGIGITLVTQRSASLNKDVLTQAGTLIAMRTPSPQDRKAVLAWIDYHAASKDVVDQLPELEAGEAWVFSPQWLKTLEKIRFRRRRTFDSGATPKVGGKPRPPARLADVDLAAIKEEMAETIERAKADDPRELRRRIANLERQIRETPTVEVPVLPQEHLDKLEVLTFGAQSIFEQTTALLHAVKALVGQETPTKEGPSARVEASRDRSSAPVSTSSRHGETAHAMRATQRSSAEPREMRPTAAGDRLPKAQDKILTALVQYGAMPAARLALITGYRQSGGFRNALSTLRTADLIAGSSSRLYATQLGVSTLGDWQPLPIGSDLLEHWKTNHLGKAEKAIVDVLADRYPDAVPTAELAELTGYQQSGGFRNALSRLRTAGIASGKGSLTLDPTFADVP